MKTKQKIFYVILTGLIALAFIACPAEEAPENNPPTIANAGTDFEHDINNSTSITLDGSGSTGNNIVYAWECTKFPTGATKPSITNANTATPTISVFNKLGNYEFTLKVTDSENAESQSSVVKVLLYRTASTTLNINVNNFSIGTVLDFAPSYGSVSNTSDFSTNNINSVLTYTLAVVNHDGSYTNTWNSVSGFDGKLSVSSNYETDLATFTQTFYHNGQQVGSPRVLKAMVDNDKFQYFGDGYGTSGSIPAINGVSISIKVTEGNIP